MTTIERLFDLSGKVALVTGASSGLGVLFAETLRDAGAIVVLAARREDRLRALCEGQERFDYVVCDVTDDASIATAVDQVLARHDGVDVLVNNAGTTFAGRAEHEPIATFRAVLEANLTGAFHLTQRVVHGMLERRRGSIVNIASVHGLVSAAPNAQGSYAASKGGLVNLTRELGVLWADQGVRVNAIAPGYFPSELTGNMLDSESGTRFITRNTPMRRPGRVEELAGALLLLASDAGSYITGQTIAVDGGWTAH